MVRVLSVAEKPSVAKELTAIISRGNSERRAGFSPYNHVFDIQSCPFKDTTVSMSITSVSGHMMELEFDAAFKNWNGCNPVDLFTAPVSKAVKKECAEIQRTLQRESRQCSILLLWLDCDLEGENIAFEVVSVCLQANPRLDVYRARFSALVERDIMRALRQPERPNQHMNDAVDARQEIDLRIGAAFTRFQTMWLQKKFDGLGQVISYGPCQFPTLGFVVERDNRIRAFRPEAFWYISVDCEYNDPVEGKKTIGLQWDRGRVYDHFSACLLFESCFDEVDGSTKPVATVVTCHQSPATKSRPVPLNTIEFQVLSSRHLRMASERAMAVAEGLYQRGILSYPRTETNFFSESYDLRVLIREHVENSTWGAYATQLLEGDQFAWLRNGQKDDQAHPPIHPTKHVELQSLGDADERAVYELVVRHFLACCSKDAVGAQTKLSAQLPLGGERFHANGLMVLQRNYLDIYGKYDSWRGQTVPRVAPGDKLVCSRVVLREGNTCPPEPLSESELIKLMDAHGIGTDATIAQHIATIQTRFYAVKDERNRFTSTPLGRALCEGYGAMGVRLDQPQLRAVMERDTQLIARGQASKQDVMARCLHDMKECFVNVRRQGNLLDQAVAKYFAAAGAAVGAGEYVVAQEALSTCSQGHMCSVRTEAAGTGNRRRVLFCGACQPPVSLPLPARGDLSADEVVCTLCGFQALAVSNPDTGKSHHLCPYCFSHPPEGVSLDTLGGGGEFRCFQCTADCVRAKGGDVRVTGCSMCREGAMILHRTTKGLTVACNNSTCKHVWWLPKFVRSATADSGPPCSCGATKLKFSIIMSKAPLGVDPESMLCCCCSSLWRQAGLAPLPRGDQSAPISLLNALPPPPQQHQHQPQPQSSYRPQQGAPPAPSLLTNYVSDYGVALTRRPEKGKAQSRAQTGYPSSTYQSNSWPQPPAGPADAAGRMCKCGMESKLLRVNKEGPTKGWSFLTCPKPRGTGCDFFQWADKSSGGGAPTDSFRSGSNSYGASREDSSRICSHCRQPGHFARNCPNK